MPFFSFFYGFICSLISPATILDDAKFQVNAVNAKMKSSQLSSDTNYNTGEKHNRVDVFLVVDTLRGRLNDWLKAFPYKEVQAGTKTYTLDIAKLNDRATVRDGALDDEEREIRERAAKMVFKNTMSSDSRKWDFIGGIAEKNTAYYIYRITLTASYDADTKQVLLRVGNSGESAKMFSMSLNTETGKIGTTYYDNSVFGYKTWVEHGSPTLWMRSELYDRVVPSSFEYTNKQTQEWSNQISQAVKDGERTLWLNENYLYGDIAVPPLQREGDKSFFKGKHPITAEKVELPKSEKVKNKPKKLLTTDAGIFLNAQGKAYSDADQVKGQDEVMNYYTKKALSLRLSVPKIYVLEALGANGTPYIYVYSLSTLNNVDYVNGLHIIDANNGEMVTGIDYDNEVKRLESEQGFKVGAIPSKEDVLNNAIRQTLGKDKKYQSLLASAMKAKG